MNTIDDTARAVKVIIIRRNHQLLRLITLIDLALSSVALILIHQLPGTGIASERRLNPESEKQLLHHYHLDLPWPQQYVIWLQGLAHGDLGDSLVNQGTEI